MLSYANLLDKIDLTLHDGTYAADKTKIGKISIELCSLVQSELDSTQAYAVEEANRYWHGAGSEKARLGYLNVISDRLDKSSKSVANSGRSAVLDRLVFCALNTNSGLDVLAGEYIAELAEALGMSADDVGQVFARHVANFI